MTFQPAAINWDATLNGASPRQRLASSAFSTARFHALGVAQVGDKEYRVEVFETIAGRMACVLRHLGQKSRGREVPESKLREVRAAAIQAYREVRSADRAKARAAFLDQQTAEAKAKICGLAESVGVLAVQPACDDDAGDHPGHDLTCAVFDNGACDCGANL